MSYVSPNCPLPRNSYDPVTACEAARAKKIVSDMEQAVSNAYAASQMIAGPSAFTSFGPNVVIDVARAQNGMQAAQMQVKAPPVNVAGEMIAAPIVVPLNVTEEEYGSCCVRGTGAIQPLPIAPPKLTMPQRLPDPITLPAPDAPLVAPHWNNLCWALRNGSVDQSQFDPAEYMALSYRCTQLGYAGACVAPPLVALYLDRARRAGTLPHISVRASDLDSIPQAPDLTGVNCPTSWSLGGMAGYRGGRRGMGSPWGDSGSMPCNWNTGAAAAPGVSMKTVGLLALAAVGLYAMGRK